jgi:arylsulfatase A-like enzyme
MFSGVMPHQCGVTSNGMAIDPAMREDELGRVFSRAGYDCVYGGKWHVPETAMPEDNDHGFRTICGFDDTHLAERCIDYLQDRPTDKPFFMVASYDNPHNTCELSRSQALPWGSIDYVPTEQCPPLPANFAIPPFEPEVIRLFQKRSPFAHGVLDWTPERWRHQRHGYNRLVEKVDAEIGKILDSLREQGVEEETLIIFTSDHGDGQGTHRWNQKHLFYEEIARIPFIVYWDGVTEAGRVSDALVSNGLDIYPTLCDFAGIEKPSHLEGVSLKSLAVGAESETSRAYVTSETWFNADYHWKIQGRMVRTQRYKYIGFTSGRYPEQLFDLEEDPGEMVNMAVEMKNQEVLDRHRHMLWEWCERTGDTIGAHYSHSNMPFLPPGFEFDGSTSAIGSEPMY